METHKLQNKIVEHNAISWNRYCVCGVFLLGLFSLFALTLLTQFFYETFKMQNSDKFWISSEKKTIESIGLMKGDESKNLFKKGNGKEKQLQIPLAMKSLNRNKREILFNNGGIVKLILGTSLPISLPDPKRSLSCFYNLQLQYTPPPRPLYWWSLFNSTTFPARREFTTDISREYIYNVIEEFFKRSNLPGTSCLLKMICEFARKPFHVHSSHRNIYHEILNAIFIPQLPNVNEKYLDAYQTGRHGAVCSYHCPEKMNWLERNSIYF